MANGKNEEAMDLIRKAALMNGNPLQEDAEINQVKGHFTFRESGG